MSKRLLVRVPWIVWRAMVWPVRKVHQTLTLAIADKISINGIVVSTAASDISADLLRLRFEQAFGLIAENDHRWIRRLQQDVAGIIVLDGEHSSYWATTNVIHVASDAISDHSSELLAALLVHEAVHARIHLQGVRSWPDIRRRIEGSCLDQQIDFLRRLPNGGALLEYYVNYRNRLADATDDMRV